MLCFYDLYIIYGYSNKYMDTLILYYISLPIVYLIHDFEELLTRRRWEKKHYNDLAAKCPKFTSLFSAIKDLNQVKYTIVILEQLLFLVISVIMAVYTDPMPMFALFWGFAIHTVIQHLFLSIVFRSYFPGLVSSVLLLPYFGYGIYYLLGVYSVAENIVMAVCGLGVISLNLALMYWLMKKFGDL